MRRVRLGLLVSLSIGLWILFGATAWGMVRTITYTTKGFTPNEFSIKVGDIVSVINQTQERLILMSLLPQGSTVQVGEIMAGRTGLLRVSGQGRYQLFSGTQPHHASVVTVNLPLQSVVVEENLHNEEESTPSDLQAGGEAVTMINQISERYIRPTPIIVRNINPTKAPQPSIMTSAIARLHIPLTQVLLISAGMVAVVVTLITMYIWWHDILDKQRKRIRNTYKRV